MAFYYDNENVSKTGDKYSAKYEREWKPGENPDFPGIYKCQSCNYEDVINRECNSLPPCSNCDSKSIKWKLLVRAMDK